jgi:hypothetical protein
MRIICKEIENGLFCVSPAVKERVSKFIPTSTYSWFTKPLVYHTTVLEPFPFFLLTEKLLDYIENMEAVYKSRDDFNVREIDELRGKLDTIHSHYERENKHLQKVLEKDNDRHESIIQGMTNLVSEYYF